MAQVATAASSVPAPQRIVQGGAYVATDSFAKILESFVSSAEGSGSGNTAGTFRGNLTRAINTYETTAKVIHGELAPLGSTISFRL